MNQPDDPDRPWWRGTVGAPLLLSAAANAIVFAGHRGLTELYNQGIAQGVISYLNGMASMFKVPGAVAVVLPVHGYMGWGRWGVMFAVNVLFYAVAFAMLLAVVRRLRSPATKPIPEGKPEATLTRRKFAAGVTGAVAAGAACVGAYSLFYEPRAFRVRRYEIGIDGLPAELDGLVVAQLTDLHHCAWIPLTYIREVVDATNALGADLVVLTGDYVRQSPVYIRPIMAELARLRARVGVVATLGNHDWWEDGALTQRCLTEAGFPVIDNYRLFVDGRRRLVGDADHGLCLAAVGDLWCDRVLYDKALGGVPTRMPRLLLSHNPDVAEERAFVSSGHRVDLMLSGHTHGGQVWLPGLGAPMTPSRYGTKYACGLVQAPTTRVFVSPGIGISGMPIRLGVRPEVSVMVLKARNIA